MLTSIRSFVRRTGRMTPKQALALDENYSVYGLSLTDSCGILDLVQVFGRRAPIILEIGFGMGSSLVKMAQTHAEKDFLGIEVHRPGLGALTALANELNLCNLKVIEGDAVAILDQHIAALSLDKIQIFFPDPWPKQRHHKRRLIQAEFVRLLSSKLKAGGILHLATDWQDYAEQMMKVLSQEPSLSNTAGYGIYAINSDRPITKFEQRGQHLGHRIRDLIFIKLE